MTKQGIGSAIKAKLKTKLKKNPFQNLVQGIKVQRKKKSNFAITQVDDPEQVGEESVPVAELENKSLT